jgi:hypothetical protein
MDTSDNWSTQLWRILPISLHHRPAKKLVICDKRHTLQTHWSILSLFPVIYSSKNVDHNSGGLHQSVDER